MTWFSDLSYRVKNHHHYHHNKHEKSKYRPPPTFGILAFEAARTMSRLVSLYRSLSEQQINKLRKEVMRSQGVAFLNSMNEGFLLKLACAERIEDLDRSAISVARFGNKCSDPGLAKFEFAYADLKLGLIDLAKVEFASREIEKIINKMEKFINATSRLYQEFETLSEMEAMERKSKRWKDHSGPITKQKAPKVEFSEQKLLFQRQIVQQLKEASLWTHPFDKVVGSMARTVCIVYARICTVFGPYISGLPNVGSRHVRFASLQLELQLQATDSQGEEPVEITLVSNSGPIGKPQSKKLVGFVRFPNKEIRAVRGENIGFRIGIEEKQDFKFGWIEKTTRLVQQAPASTVGGSGLALRYANLIMSLEKYFESPSSLTDCGRDDLYEMLPQSLKTWVSSKLCKLYRNQSELRWWEDSALVEGWRDGLKVILGWLAPIAHDTIVWVNERNFEKYDFDAKPTVLLLQTLYFADRDKTEAAIVEVLVGLSFICRYELD